MRKYSDRAEGIYFFFFFSSRRRHTRFDCDWSSDVCSSDLQMPEMDGFEATGRIREMEKATGGHTRIVAMTAHAMAGDRERCRSEERRVGKECRSRWSPYH